MPIYDFSCPACGPFEAAHPMTEVPRSGSCPGCGGAARRVFSTAGLSRAGAPAVRAIDAAAVSAESPGVVGAPPSPGRSAPVTRDPRHLKRPRP